MYYSNYINVDIINDVQGAPFDNLKRVENRFYEIINFNSSEAGIINKVIRNDLSNTEKVYPYTYTNYTIDTSNYGDEHNYVDIDYSHFWTEHNDDVKKALGEKISDEINYDDSHFVLYKYDAGDMALKSPVNDNEKASVFSYEKYAQNQNYSDGITYSSLINETIESIHYNVDITLYNNRIVAAMPIELLIRGNKELDELLIDNMHIYNNYDEEKNNRRADFRGRGELGDLDKEIAKNKLYHYVDVVIQRNDGVQYIVPFTVVDVKWLHQNHLYGYHYPMYTDNRYGHVNERQVPYNNWNELEINQLGYVSEKDKLDSNKIINKYYYGKWRFKIDTYLNNGMIIEDLYYSDNEIQEVLKAYNIESNKKQEPITRLNSAYQFKYPSQDDERKYVNIDIIEPCLRIRKIENGEEVECNSNEIIGKADGKIKKGILKYIFGEDFDNCKIVSMRWYADKNEKRNISTINNSGEIKMNKIVTHNIYNCSCELCR